VGVVTRGTVLGAFGADERFDIDGAWYQLALAGLVLRMPQEMPEDEAIGRVRDYVLGRGLDTSGYPMAELVADRFNCCWMVYVPVPRGQLAVGRAIFYVADDGVLEHSSSSVAPVEFVAEFERRYRRRQGARTW
jgi:hypothetical protein